MWEQIQANRRRSLVLITAMAVVLVVMGYAAGELIVGPSFGPVGLIVAVAIWAGLMLTYFSAGESLLLHGTNARELRREESPQLFNVVEEMQLAAGLPGLPRVYLIDDPAPNAFAFGRKPEQAAVAVTTGLLYRLNRDELQGVIAHEIGHIKNRDAQFMMLAAVMLGSIALLAEIIWRSMRYGGRARGRARSRGGGQAQLIILVVALIFAVLGPLLAQLLYFACSRKREYLADASGAQFTRYPEGLAAALEKIAQAAAPVSFANKVNAPMFIVNPLAADADTSSIFSTHPPLAQRIRILRSMTGAALADYEQAFRRTVGGTVIGPQSLRAAPAQTIRPPSNTGPILTRQDTRQVAQFRAGYIPITCNCGLQTSVPDDYERAEIRCLRCGSILPVPTAAAPIQPQTANRAPVTLEYHRTNRSGWESFRCACGRTVQLSPAFTVPRIRCNNCGRMIQIT